MVVLKPKNGVAKSKRKCNADTLNCIPRELLTEIFGRVASASCTDLFNVKTSCKEFLDSASDDYIFKRVTIDSFPVIPWKITNGESTFLDKCMKCGNPESLFRQGMKDYFSTTFKHDSGLDYLKRATNEGHMVATYVYGIILVCYGGELKQQGFKLLSELLRSKSGLIVYECRRRVSKILRVMWRNDYLAVIGPTKEYMNKIIKSCSCIRKASSSLATKRSSSSLIWESFGDVFEDDKFSCHSCLWDPEAVRFCNNLRKGEFKCRLA